MRKRKLWKQVVSLAVSAVLLISAPTVSAAEGGQNPQTEEADANGFVIENSGVKKYTGNAAEVVIPEGVTHIKYGAFSGCSSLSEINVSESNEFYASEDGCLYNKEKTELVFCPGAKEEITISGTMTEIRSDAFSNCWNLKTIKISEGVTNIDNNMFASCRNLSSISIPGSVTNIGKQAFDNCSNLKIYGKEGSYAQTYAQEKGLSFTIGEIPEHTPGPESTPEPEPEPVPQPVRKRFLSFCDVRLNTTSYTYDGKAKTPAVTVKDGYQTLTKDTDYTVSYQNNVNVGTATVIVTGIGNYTETVTVDFTIEKAEVRQKEISKCKITLSTTSYTYDGKIKKPAVTVKDGKTTLKLGTDYTVSYKNNKNAGKA